MMINGHEIIISASIGVSMAENDYDCSPTTLVKQADIAMYNAKDAGRNQYCLYCTDLSEEATELKHIQQEIQYALERKELSLEFQPQRDVVSKEILGHEALMRWHSQAMGKISPSRFIPVVEDCGLIHEFTRWLLVESLYWQSQRHAKHQHEVISINLSAKNLFDQNFANIFKDTCKNISYLPK